MKNRISDALALWTEMSSALCDDDSADGSAAPRAGGAHLSIDLMQILKASTGAIGIYVIGD